MFFSISCSKCSFSNPLLSIRMKIAVSATMLNHRDMKLFQKFGLEFIKTIGYGSTFINRISQIFFLRKKYGGCWFETILDNFLIDFIHQPYGKGFIQKLTDHRQIFIIATHPQEAEILSLYTYFKKCIVLIRTVYINLPSDFRFITA